MLALGTAVQAGAQAGSEGLFLLLPVGARAVGMGEAVVAQRGGSDVLWWNPAGIGGAGRHGHEVALHSSQSVIGQENALAVVIPTRGSSTLAVSLNVLDLGRQVATDAFDNPNGVITPTDFAYGLTYAVLAAPWLSFGATVKHVEARISCSGLCVDVPTGGSSSNGADLGTQVRFTGVPVTIGLAARNLGVGRGDSRAARIDFGGDYRVLAVERYTDEVEVHAAAGLVATPGLDSTTAHIGTDVILDKRLHVRAGYIHDATNGSGAAVGVGLSSGKLMFDIARTYGGITSSGDKQPTYFSLRYVW